MGTKTQPENLKDSEKSYLKMRTQTDQIRYEFTNQDTVAFRKNGMYHKAMGNSAVILKMLGAKTKVRSGFDPVTKQEVLEMSIHVGKIKNTKLFLETLGKEVLRDDEDFFVVRLKKPIDAKRMRKEKRDLVLKSEVTEDILMKRRKQTPMAKEVRDIFKEAGALVRTMKGTDGLVLGRAILDEIMELQRTVRILMRDTGKSEEIRQAVDDAADNVQGMLLLAPNFANQADRLSRMGRSLNRIRAELKKLDADSSKAKSKQNDEQSETD